MSHAPGVRQAQKEQTRRALLDAGLRLLDRQSLSSLGLREVTREVGVAPAAFYRHFPDMAALGVALVGEALGSLHAVVRDVMAGGTDGPAPVEPADLIDRAVALTVAYADEHRAHVRFIARERYGGVRPVREAIAAELDRFTTEVAAGLAAQPESAGWRPAELRVLAGLYVDHMVLTAAAVMEAPQDDTAARASIAETARLRMRIVSLGRRHWPQERAGGAGGTGGG